MKLKNKKLILVILSLFIIGFIIGFVSDRTFAVGEEIVNEVEEEDNFLLKIIGGAFRIVSMAFYGLLNMADASIDKLVYNQGGPLSGLTLFKDTPAQAFLAQFYNIFNYIAIALFIPIIYWSGITFIKAGDNPQGKSILKDRLMKIALTFVLLYTMPEILSIIVKVSDGFTDTFAKVSSGSVNPVGDYINTLKSEDVTFVNGITTLMLVGINLWMIFYYIVRDLTICFLFMFFPIVAIWYPLDGGMVKAWWQNMAGNILSQPIQAVALSMVITMSNSIPTTGFLTGVYMIVAFGSIIPMTGIIKGFLGLEGRVGAASSRAGLGGLFSALAMTRMTKRSFDSKEGNLENIKEGHKELGGNKIASEELEKNIRPEGAGASRIEEVEKPLVTPRASSNTSFTKEVTKESINDSNRQAHKKIAKGVGGIAGAAFTGVVGASIGGGMSGFQGAAMMGVGGGVLGSKVGGNVGSRYADSNMGKEMNRQMESEIKDLQHEELVASYKSSNPSLQGEPSEDDLQTYLDKNPELEQASLHTAQEKYLKIYDEKLSGTGYQNQERVAKLESKRISNKLTDDYSIYESKLAYASLRAKQHSDEEISSLPGVQLYQDKDKSYLFTKSESGELNVLRTGAGIANMQGSMTVPVSFGDNNLGVADDMSLQFTENASIDATNYMRTAYPNMPYDDPEYKGLYNERYRETSREQMKDYQDKLESTRSNMNIQTMNIKTDTDNMKFLVEQSKERRESYLKEEIKRKEAIIIKENLSKVGNNNTVVDSGYRDDNYFEKMWESSVNLN